VERWIGKFARDIKVHKTCAHIILQAKSTILTDTGLEESVDNYVGNGIAGEIVDQEQTYVGLSGTCVNITAFAELVVVNIDPFTMDIVIGVRRNGYTQESGHRCKADHAETHYIITFDCIVEDFNITCCHKKNSGARWSNGGKPTRNSKVVAVVLDNEVVKDSCFLTVLSKPRKIQHHHTCGIILHFVVVHIGVDGVFYFDTDDVPLRLRVSDNRVGGLSYVDACVGCSPSVAAFNEYACTKDRVDAVAAICGRTLSRPYRLHVPKGYQVRVFNLYGIPFCVLYCQTFNGKVYRVGYKQAVASARLASKGEDRLPFALPNNFEILPVVYCKRGSEIEGAGLKPDGTALGINQALLYLRLCHIWSDRAILTVGAGMQILVIFT